MAILQERAIRSRRAAHRQRLIGSFRLKSWSMRAALSAAPLLGQSLPDHARELRIWALGRLIYPEASRAMRARCWRLMRQEIFARSEAQVLRMESAAGLTR